MYLYNYYNYLRDIDYINALCKQVLSFKVMINSSFNYVYKHLILRMIIVLIVPRCRSPGFFQLIM